MRKNAMNRGELANNSFEHEKCEIEINDSVKYMRRDIRSKQPEYNFVPCATQGDLYLIGCFQSFMI